VIVCELCYGRKGAYHRAIRAILDDKYILNITKSTKIGTEEIEKSEN